MVGATALVEDETDLGAIHVAIETNKLLGKPSLIEVKTGYWTMVLLNKQGN